MIDLWTATLDDVGDVDARWLTPEERTKHLRFATRALQREYLVTRCLARWVLSQYAAVAPAAWRFAHTEPGRPFVASPDVAVPSFNLAHADGLVVCAVATSTVGVDIESLAHGEELRAMNVFTPKERDGLDARRAVELWTLKEAYLKGRGGGIDMKLARLEIADVQDWQLTLLALPEPWIGAVAVQHDAPEPVVIRTVGRDTFGGR